MSISILLNVLALVGFIVMVGHARAQFVMKLNKALPIIVLEGQKTLVPSHLSGKPIRFTGSCYEHPRLDIQVWSRTKPNWVYVMNKVNEIDWSNKATVVYY